MFHPRWRKRRELQQAFAAVDVQPTCRHAGAVEDTGRTNGMGAREKYKAKVIWSTTTCGDVRILLVQFHRRSTPERAHHERGSLEKRRNGFIDHRRLDQRLVSLNVHDQRRRQTGAISAIGSVPPMVDGDVMRDDPSEPPGTAR
jgi:hypothetical protein